jgi:hypothetical protein
MERRLGRATYVARQCLRKTAYGGKLRNTIVSQAENYLMRDIFTLQPLDDPGREHVLPAQLGGKLVSTELVQKSTNNALGSKLESAIAQDLRMFLNALGMTSRRGKTVGYDLITPDSEFALTSGFKPAPRRIGMTESFVDGKRLLTITARTTEEARRLIEGAKRRYPDLDLASAKPVQKRQYVNEPIQHRLSIGGPLFLRAIAKTAFEGLALAAGNVVAGGKCFDDFRRWMLAALSEDRTPALETEKTAFGNHDYRRDLWQGLPRIENAPFQHRVFVIGGRALGGAYGLVELFGALRFSAILTVDDDLPDCSFGYLVDPVSGIQLRDPGFTLQIPRGVVECHKIVLEDFSDAIRTFMRNVQEKHEHETISKIVRESMKKSLPAEGEIIQEEHIQAFARVVAEGFARHLFRTDSEVPLDLNTLEPEGESEDA